MRLYEVKGFFTKPHWTTVHVIRQYYFRKENEGTAGIGNANTYVGVRSVCRIVVFMSEVISPVMVDMHDVYKYKLCRKCKRMIKNL